MKYELLDLGCLLDIWEDMNRQREVATLAAELYTALGMPSEVVQKFHEILHDDQMSTVWVKPISRYLEFRRLLEKNNPSELNELVIEKFLPPVPKNMQESFPDPIVYTAFNFSSILLAPPVLANWAIDKKVCTITQHHLIQDIAPSNALGNNYLKQLPYDNFIVDLIEPISFTGEVLEETVAVQYKHIIIGRDEDSIMCYCVPMNLEEYSYSEEDIRHTDTLIKIFKDGMPSLQRARHSPQIPNKLRRMHSSAKPHLKKIAEIDFTVAEALPSMIIYHMNKEEILPAGFDIVTMNDNDYVFRNRVLSIINGISKMLAEHTAEIASVFHNESELTTTASDPKIEHSEPVSYVNESFEWFQVPSSNVDYLKIQKTKGGVKISITRSHEKSPHLRRKHIRKYRDADGKVIREIWVQSSKVRKDLLEKGQQAKSGAITI